MKHFKKGVQYSHYLGSLMLEIQSSADMATDPKLAEYMEGEQANPEFWARRLKEKVTELRNKIAELDRINGMEY